jgi:hypothetical protein
MRRAECTEHVTKRFARLTSGVRRTLQSVATETGGTTATIPGVTVTVQN